MTAEGFSRTGSQLWSGVGLGGNGTDSFSWVPGWSRVVHPEVISGLLLVSHVFSLLSFGPSLLVSHSDIVPLKWSLACTGNQ